MTYLLYCFSANSILTNGYFIFLIDNQQISNK